jgi:hypothetical protein
MSNLSGVTHRAARYVIEKIEISRQNHGSPYAHSLSSLPMPWYLRHAYGTVYAQIGS